MASRWSLKPASGVRFVHSQPQRGRSAARISGSDPEDSGSNPLPAANSFHAGVVQLDQDTRLRTERLEGSSPSARTILRPLVQGTGHSPPKAGIGVRVAGGRPSSTGGESAGATVRAGDRLARYPAVYRVKAGSIPVPRAKVMS